MISKSSFVVGTINGKTVSYIVDKHSSQNRSSTAGTTKSSVSGRPPTEINSFTLHQQKLEEAARVNGSVTLTQHQLQELLALLNRHAPSGPQKPHDAWLSSTSSCGFSVGEESDFSSPVTPGLESIPVTPGPAPDECTLEHVGKIEADLAQSKPYDRLTFEVPTKDQSLECFYDNGIERQDQKLDNSVLKIGSVSEKNLSQNSSCNNTCGSQPGMKPSLLEQKKQQWAKERAELEGLCSPWGRNTPHATTRDNHPSKPNVLASSPSSLPVISQDYVSPSNFSNEPDWRGRSNSIGYVNEDTQFQSSFVSSAYSHHHDGLYSKLNSRNHLDIPSPVGGGSSADESSFCVGNKTVRFTARTPGEGEEHADEGRPKWGDRGVGVGHLWEPSVEPTARLPDPPVTSVSPGAYPAWLEKGLNKMEASPVAIESRNFLRGQNVPLDPEEMEERAKKRQKALELQKAIKQQLEERDRKRREERERRLLEDRREEERVHREQELERIRMEQERKKEQAAKEAKEATTPGTGKQNQAKITKGPKVSRDTDKPINLSPRIVDVSQRSKQPDLVWEETSSYNGYTDKHMPRALQELRINTGHITHHGDQETGMMMVGQEVAVLLAPELEERLLHSRTAKDQATQTDTSQQLVRESQQKYRKPRANRTLSERPQWGAHRSTKRYMKQSDKDVYRQRSTNVDATPPHQLQQQSRHHSESEKRAPPVISRSTVDSTEESDRTHSNSMTRRDNSQYVGTRQYHSSDDESPSPTHRAPAAWGSGRVQVWSNPSKNCPPSLHSPASLADLQQPIDYFDAIFNPPIRTTNSPPVPAVAKKMEKQPELYKQPPRRETSRPPVYSPPVPAVMRKLQEIEETSVSQLPMINDTGNKSAPPTLQGESSALLPSIQSQHSSHLQFVDILSQLSTLRKALHTKQVEWEMRSDTPYSDS